MPAPLDFYEVLGVSPRASEDEIREAYRTRAMYRHRRGALRLAHGLRRMSRAYETLIDADWRREHDRKRELYILEPRRIDNEVTAEGFRREGRMRRRYRHELARESAKEGERAMERHAPLLAALEGGSALSLAVVRPASSRSLVLVWLLLVVAAGALAYGLLGT